MSPRTRKRVPDVERSEPWYVYVRSFPCVTCGATAGEHCRTQTGNVAGDFHVVRVNTAVRAQRGDELWLNPGGDA